MRLMKELLERSGVSRHLAEAPLPEPCSDRGYSPSVVVESYLVNLWMGCYRMSQTEVLRRDDVPKALFGWKQTPLGSSYGRFFNKFARRVTKRSFRYSSNASWIASPLRKLTLDVDSSVIMRYGEPSRALPVGLTGKPVRRSHHSLLDVWCLYRERGDAENRIKEHKYEFGIEGFHLKNLWGTEAAFRFNAGVPPTTPSAWLEPVWRGGGAGRSGPRSS
jgi:hypothetical protein